MPERSAKNIVSTGIKPINAKGTESIKKSFAKEIARNGLYCFSFF
mgnify:CR=1 FL=1